MIKKYVSDNPQLLAEWHPTKNGNLSSDTVSIYSKKKVWWLCREGHDWLAVVQNRALQGAKCPYCSNRFAWSGFNDLASQRPEIAAEWHPTKNGSLTPDQVTVGSNKKVWWLCRNGHEWLAIIESRTLRKAKCPYCTNRLVWPGFNDLASQRPEIVAEWHPTKNGSLTPDQVAVSSRKKVWWLCRNGHEWLAIIENRTVDNNGCPYCTGRSAYSGFNDLASQKPEIVAEWHPTKNGSLTPDQVTVGSNKKVWWLCKEGHNWLAVIASRTLYGEKCPYCTNRLVWPGFNDLASQRPEIADEWHPTKNGSLTPDQVTAGSNKKVWWLCKNGHEWPAIIENRTLHKAKCPYCTNRLVWPGFNDLASQRPEIAAEWHPTKNGSLTPDQVTAGSNKKVWWLCKNGHEWPTSIENRTLCDHGCPYCTGRYAWPGFNDLASQMPEVATEWHPTKNGSLTPDHVTAYSTKKVWWQCKSGHEWQSIIESRTREGLGCPYDKGIKKYYGKYQHGI